MPIDIDENLVNAAIIEFHDARDQGKSDFEAWSAAIVRVRHDVLTIAAMTCEQISRRSAARGERIAAATARSCAAAIRDLG